VTANGESLIITTAATPGDADCFYTRAADFCITVFVSCGIDSVGSRPFLVPVESDRVWRPSPIIIFALDQGWANIGPMFIKVKLTP
jgi:hypothetical protein